ncbi:MAG: hypothetical protein IT441_08275 [Phycisphaeraceae bacterium]|nr:hypothetical protein [Phycisphaeraceae bacterium]
MNRRHWLTLGTVMLMGLMMQALPARAEDAPKDHARMSVGKITAVADDHMSFELTMGESDKAHKMTIQVNDQTKYMLDGEDSTIDKVLVVGNRVKVAHVDGTATKVNAITKPGKDGDKGKDKDKGDKGKDKDKDKGDKGKDKGDKGKDKDKGKEKDKDKGDKGKEKD